MKFNVFNRLGKKIATEILPHVKNHTWQHRDNILLDQTSKDWQIGDQLMLGNKIALIIDSNSTSEFEENIFVEFV